MNAVNYGLPQKRERVIMIGRRFVSSIVFPQPTHFFEVGKRAIQFGVFLKSWPTAIPPDIDLKL
ncbi:MAG: hypothetical protein VSS75_021380 [Candidatus Parabeggiatoa sp.]|nr:hypothetical protein [Candidatus Parabeggiatoa sp.]